MDIILLNVIIYAYIYIYTIHYYHISDAEMTYMII